MSERIDQIDSYLDGELSATEVAELRQWITAEPSHARAFAQRAVLHQEIRSILHRSRVQTVQNPRDILQELLEQETSAQADMVEVIDLTTLDRRQSGRTQRLRLIYTNPAFISGIAAVLILAVSLFLIFQSGSEDPVLTNADPIATPTTPHVATLNETANAQWLDSAPADGEKLVAHRRLTLLDGMAKITTSRGAIAILEGPCTIEFTENNNALKLHQGKLVGKCLTRHSKGFNVITPSTQVIDLGTEFAVEVTDSGETNVVVFEGLVALAQPGIDPRTAQLTEIAAGQAKQVVRTGQIAELDAAIVKQAFVRTVDPAAQYEAMVLADQPLLYYRMDQVIGGIERNLAADRYHATIYGNVTTATQGLRSSFSLGSFGDYLQTTEPIEELRGAASYTLECWVKPSRNDFGSILMLGAENITSELGVDVAARLEQTEPLGYIGPAQHIRFIHVNELLDGKARTDKKHDSSKLFASEPYALDRWIHVATVKDGKNLSLYIDGKLNGTQQVDTPLLDQEQQIMIGRYSTKDIGSPSHTRQFLGELDELAVYDHALSPDAILERYEAGQFWLANE